MKTIFFILTSVIFISLSGCNNNEKEIKNIEQQKINKNIMGDGNEPMPPKRNYNSLNDNPTEKK
jgi:hypothetical protein